MAHLAHIGGQGACVVLEPCQGPELKIRQAEREKGRERGKTRPRGPQTKRMQDRG